MLQDINLPGDVFEEEGDPVVVEIIIRAFPALHLFFPWLKVLIRRPNLQEQAV
jgi:L-rhamnose isomerase